MSGDNIRDGADSNGDGGDQIQDNKENRIRRPSDSRGVVGEGEIQQLPANKEWVQRDD